MNSRRQRRHISMGRMLLVVALAALAVGSPPPAIAATQFDILGPAGSGAFGTSVTALPNGNIVVTDPGYDAGAIADVGAVYLYDGETGVQISMLTGSTAQDRVGYVSDYASSVTVLSNGNYVVRSPNWDNGAVINAGAVTWCSATAGLSGVVAAANSLVGSTAEDQAGYVSDYGSGVTALSNGNYVVRSPYWDNGVVVDAGAVTWGNGATGTVGAMSAANSLVGSTAQDRVGYLTDTAAGVVGLGNGHYVVISPNWDNGAVVDAGAVTWGSGTTGVSGTVSEANSLAGSTAGDGIGSGSRSVTVLSNGNYVVRSPYWDNGLVVDAGAVTWGSGTAGVSGTVSAANSLVGSTAEDRVGYVSTSASGVAALTNGNYVVSSPNWDNGAAVDAGAVTWGNGTTGTTGMVSAANSLVGSSSSDQVGSGTGSRTTTVLTNGNYVVGSPNWNTVGAATWGNGTTGTVGVVSAANSLVGSAAGDKVGYFVPALSNGNYVVLNPFWDNGAVVDAGASTWGNGTTGIAGVISAASSLVGSSTGDQVGYAGYLGMNGLTALSNGNYVVSSQYWDNGAVVDAGASTWGNGTTGTVGVVSVANSLVGSTNNDQVSVWVAPLSNGNYVVSSQYWDNGAVVDAGAATWGNGTTGTVGPVSVANSLVGSTNNDQVGPVLGVRPLTNGNYAVSSQSWDNGAVDRAGAVTWGNGATGISGPVSATNSLVGSTDGDQVGSTYLAALSAGNYVVSSPYWDNGAVVDAGAVTWGSGAGDTLGPITADNSVLGTAADGGESMTWAYDGLNHQLVVGRPMDNIVTLFRLPAVPTFHFYLPIVLNNAP